MRFQVPEVACPRRVTLPKSLLQAAIALESPCEPGYNAFIMGASYLTELSLRAGLQLFPTLSTFKTDNQSSKGTGLGMRGGFPVAVALVSVGNHHSVAAMVCYRKQDNVQQLETALKDLPEFKGFAVRKTIKV